MFHSVYETLKNHQYVPGRYHKFIIYEPKMRVIQSQDMFDKVVNHLVSKEILLPSIEKSLIDTNVASRKGKGTSYGIQKYFKYRNIMDRKYTQYYLLKCDIHHFFASIKHDILKEKLKRKIKEKESLQILETIIDSTEEGLPIGLMTLQILAIFYLNDLDHYIKEELKIKYYIRYQDDFVLIHHDKEYLKYCLSVIKQKLQELDMQLNKKTKIYKNTENINFIGIKKNYQYSKLARTRKKYKKNLKKYQNQEIDLTTVLSSKISYESRKEGYHYES